MKHASLTIEYNEATGEVKAAELTVDGELVRTLDPEELEFPAADLFESTVLAETDFPDVIEAESVEITDDDVLGVFDVEAMSTHKIEVVHTDLEFEDTDELE